MVKKNMKRKEKVLTELDIKCDTHHEELKNTRSCWPWLSSIYRSSVLHVSVCLWNITVLKISTINAKACTMYFYHIIYLHFQFYTPISHFLIEKENYKEISTYQLYMCWTLDDYNRHLTNHLAHTDARSVMTSPYVHLGLSCLVSLENLEGISLSSTSGTLAQKDLVWQWNLREQTKCNQPSDIWILVLIHIFTEV